MSEDKILSAGLAAVVTDTAVASPERQVRDEQIIAALARQKIALRVKALATAQAIAWWIVLTPDQREDCIKQAIEMQGEGVN